jgi:hypothetical protein
MKSTLKITKWGHFKDFKWSLCTKSRLFEGPETFLDPLMARAIVRAILGPKKSTHHLELEVFDFSLRLSHFQVFTLRFSKKLYRPHPVMGLKLLCFYYLNTIIVFH